MYLPNPIGSVMFTDPSPSSRTTQLVPGWWGFEVMTGEAVVIACSGSGGNLTEHKIRSLIGVLSGLYPTGMVRLG